jgi:acyl carrier protein
LSADLSTVVRVRQLIREALSVEVPSDDIDLMEAGFIDSLAFVMMITEIEREFDVEFSLDDLDLTQFRSVDRIVESLAKLSPAMI